jgi:hypothetical protein
VTWGNSASVRSWSREELDLLEALIAEGHSPASASVCFVDPPRSPYAVEMKAREFIKGRFRQAGRHTLRVNGLSTEVIQALETVSADINVSASRLVKILLTVITRKNLFPEILDLQRHLK